MNSSTPSPQDATLRLFFALWPEGRALGSLGPWQEHAHALCGGRMMRAETLHLTLAFLGQATPEQAQALTAHTRADRIDEGEIELRHYGAFPRQGIVWAGPEADDPATQTLHGIHDRLWNRLQDLGWQRPDQAFKPHVTLLRKADCSALPAPMPEPVVWAYRHYVLVSSEPNKGMAQYRVLARSGADGG
ncbi:RNA 2',3'-cyclic phosphodiesterase [Bordetella genomosp. 13]|uniref:RNA 2',3'-cyclic phosphodiesterase n=1 Tax=Bordetella genomosp. 13 TaxID=463040 RepID=A0A1W6ZHY6_9BORD|nr:RNA 2',3'-cyclic phosphodiesterase [Bordetella genomosp. 13]ARP96760.1 2'-5' RNA ligase [Bordetella genomosp. 13]